MKKAEPDWHKPAESSAAQETSQEAVVMEKNKNDDQDFLLFYLLLLYFKNSQVVFSQTAVFCKNKKKTKQIISRCALGSLRTSGFVKYN